MRSDGQMELHCGGSNCVLADPAAFKLRWSQTFTTKLYLRPPSSVIGVLSGSLDTFPQWLIIVIVITCYKVVLKPFLHIPSRLSRAAQPWGSLLLNFGHLNTSARVLAYIFLHSRAHPQVMTKDRSHQHMAVQHSGVLAVIAFHFINSDVICLGQTQNNHNTMWLITSIYS